MRINVKNKCYSYQKFQKSIKTSIRKGSNKTNAFRNMDAGRLETCTKCAQVSLKLVHIKQLNTNPA